MPVLHSYVNKAGLYITARPSDVGNVTYQTTSEADEFIRSLGYEDGDNLPWGLINPLRSAGMIYTNNQGVDQDLGEAPHLDPSELPELSEDERQQLLSYLESRGDVPKEVYEHIKGLSDKADGKNSSNDRDFIDGIFLDPAVSHQFPQEETNINFVRQPENNKHIVEVRLEDRKVRHVLEISDVIESWTVFHSYDESWEGMAKAYETRPKIMRAIGEVEGDLTFDIGWTEIGDSGYNI
jgi:hypothetical protein